MINGGRDLLLRVGTRGCVGWATQSVIGGCPGRAEPAIARYSSCVMFCMCSIISVTRPLSVCVICKSSASLDCAGNRSARSRLAVPS
jgi:hypothetical protein